MCDCGQPPASCVGFMSQDALTRCYDGFAQCMKHLSFCVWETGLKHCTQAASLATAYLGREVGERRAAVDDRASFEFLRKNVDLCTSQKACHETCLRATHNMCVKPAEIVGHPEEQTLQTIPTAGHRCLNMGAGHDGFQFHTVIPANWQERNYEAGQARRKPSID